MKKTNISMYNIRGHFLLEKRIINTRNMLYDVDDSSKFVSNKGRLMALIVRG